PALVNSSLRTGGPPTSPRTSPLPRPEELHQLRLGRAGLRLEVVLPGHEQRHRRQEALDAAPRLQAEQRAAVPRHTYLPDSYTFSSPGSEVRITLPSFATNHQEPGSPVGPPKPTSNAWMIFPQSVHWYSIHTLPSRSRFVCSQPT